MMVMHAATAFALVLAQTTSTPPRRCVTPEQAGAGAAVMLPEMVNLLARSCERHLPETAYLRTHGLELVERWRTESASFRQVATAGLSRMIPPEAMAAMAQGMASTEEAHDTGDQRSIHVRTAPPSASATPLPSPMGMLPQMMEGLSQGMTDKLNSVTCKEASRFVESLAPLPAANIAQLVSAVMGIGLEMAPPKGDDGPPICRT